MSVTERKPDLAPLTGIRAAAAGWVVVEHLGLMVLTFFPVLGPLTPWIDGGFLGVEVFFVLSGFIIAYNYAERMAAFSGRAYIAFIKMRLARIYPVHLVTVLIVVGLAVVAFALAVPLNGASNFTIGNTVGNVLLLQALPSFAALNGPAWSISAEFAAYLAFPFLALVLTRITTVRSGVLTAVALSVFTVAAFAAALTSPEASATSGAIIWLRIGTEFSLGAVIYCTWRHLGARRRATSWDAVALFSAGGLVLVLGVTGGDLTSLLAVPLIAVFVLGCAGSSGVVARALSSRFMQWGGRISYSVYMTHALVLIVFGKIFRWQDFVGSSLGVRSGVLLAYVGVIVVAGAACYYVVEVPGRKAVRRLRLPTQRTNNVADEARQPQ